MCSDTVFRNIGINSVLALLFTTYPLAPAAIAFLANGGRVALAYDEIGHEIQVTGTSSSPSGGTDSGTMGQTSNSSHQAIEVSSVKHISETCKNGTSR